jgi:hypothetical protein
VVAALIVLAFIVYAATGRGGELSAERPDYAAPDLGPVTAADVALLRPPTALWGYDMQATDEALERIADSIRARDVRIVALEQLVSDLSRTAAPRQPGGPAYQAARHRRAGEFTPPTLPAVLPVSPGDSPAPPGAGPVPPPAGPGGARERGTGGAPPERSHD